MSLEVLGIIPDVWSKAYFSRDDSLFATQIARLDVIFGGGRLRKLSSVTGF